MTLRRSLTFALLAAAASRPLPAQPAPVPPPRGEIDDLRVTLEAALARTARAGLPSPLHAPGHVYRLKGYGAMIVLAPRALPARRVVVRTVVDPETEALRSVTQARRDLERDLAGDRHPERRAELEASLARLKETEAELRHRAAAAGPHSTRRVVVSTTEDGPVSVQIPALDLADLERQMESQMAAQAAAIREMETAQGDWSRAGEQAMREHLRLVEEQAEAFRAEAERARRQAERAVRTRLGPLPPSVAVGEPAPIAPVPAPEPHPPVAPVAPAAPVTAPTEEVTAPEAPEPPPPPPWHFWLEPPAVEAATEPADPGPAVAIARDSLASCLESYSRPLRTLRPEEYVTVAVDFVADRLLRKAPARTLIVRVRVRDLQERQAGRLSAAELRKRIEFEED